MLRITLFSRAFSPSQRTQQAISDKVYCTALIAIGLQDHIHVCDATGSAHPEVVYLIIHFVEWRELQLPEND